MEGTTEMSKKKVIHSPESLAVADAILKAYDPKTAADAQDALKDAFGPIFEALLKGELENHLGYSSNDKGAKNTENRRNGSSPKTLKPQWALLKSIALETEIALSLLNSSQKDVPM